MENLLQEIKFNENGLIPAIAQDVRTDEVLMMAWMNREALEMTLETGKVHYYSRSRQKLWLKGETSGHFQFVRSIRLDCDGDTLLLKVEQVEAACHTGHHSCFYRALPAGGFPEPENVGQKPEAVREPVKAASSEAAVDEKSGILQEVYDIIIDRTIHPREGSYTNYLFTKGLDKMLKKVGEETAELIVAAKNRNKDELRYEIADLLYHVLIVMAEGGLKPGEVYGELEKRR